MKGKIKSDTLAELYTNNGAARKREHTMVIQRAEYNPRGARRFELKYFTESSLDRNSAKHNSLLLEQPAIRSSTGRNKVSRRTEAKTKLALASSRTIRRLHFQVSYYVTHATTARSFFYRLWCTSCCLDIPPPPPLLLCCPLGAAKSAFLAWGPPSPLPPTCPAPEGRRGCWTCWWL